MTSDSPTASPGGSCAAPPIRILHLEDRRADALLVRSVLEAEGIDCEIVNVDTREAFIAALQTGAFDVILADYRLPSFDGISALRIARETSPDIPFIFVSGTMGEELSIETLKAGATDYVLKERLSRLVPSLQRALAEAHERRERRRADEALRQSELKYRSIVETTSEWIWESDEEGRLTYCNSAVEPMVGYRPEELLGKKGDDFLHPDDLQEIGPVVERAVAEKSGWKALVLRWRHKDGRYRSIESNAVAVIDAGAAFRGFRGATHDITERLNLEAQLRQAQKMEAIGQLAGGIAHDFNNVLTAILGYADLLTNEVGKGSPLLESIGEIRKAGERAASLTRQLLAFSRRQVLEPKVLDLNVLVEDLKKMLRRLIGEDVELVTVLDPGIGRVRADAGQIEQMVMNLAVNARDAMPKGGTLTVETKDVELGEAYAREHISVRPGRYVMLAFSDTGLGMSAETKSHMFEPFFTTKGKGKGTGLGLATVYGIVKQSGGNIWVYSELDHGTTFKVYLPRVEEAVDAAPTRRVPLRQMGGSETLLLVEDEQSVRTLVRRILESYGYTVIEASGALQALEAARRWEGPIHLVLTDVVMPEMGGSELAPRVAQLRPDVRVIFMSGYTDDAILRQGLIAEGGHFLQKPFTPDALARKVRDVLDREP